MKRNNYVHENKYFFHENNSEQVALFHLRIAEKDRKKVVKVCQSCSFFKLNR